MDEEKLLKWRTGCRSSNGIIANLHKQSQCIPAVDLIPNPDLPFLLLPFLGVVFLWWFFFGFVFQVFWLVFFDWFSGFGLVFF